jgi:hypothetical protein
MLPDPSGTFYFLNTNKTITKGNCGIGTPGGEAIFE